ncbi:MAG: F0F1 ATP synthase subunit delta [Lachnospiraceae bacterium]|jgi:F-type H+-transporting ATPase subunit delta|nr:F0F1 ATP synthase subunit delta [Lachnospiraceae bacterium]
MAKLISKTYGDALFELALEENRIDDYVAEVDAMLTIFRDNPELSKLLNHPKISKEEKITVVGQIFEGKISKELLGLINMIVEKDRNNAMEDIFKYFIDRVKEYKNIGVAKVTSAVELSDAQKSQVEKRLLETTGYVKFEISYDVDKDLIGGMVIRIGDRVVDSSIRTRLYELTKELNKIQMG